MLDPKCLWPCSFKVSVVVSFLKQRRDKHGQRGGGSDVHRAEKGAGAEFPAENLDWMLSLKLAHSRMEAFLCEFRLIAAKIILDFLFFLLS